MRMHNLRRRLDSDAVQRAVNYTTSIVEPLVMKLTKMNKERRKKAMRSFNRKCIKAAIHPSLIKV